VLADMTKEVQVEQGRCGVCGLTREQKEGHQRERRLAAP